MKSSAEFRVFNGIDGEFLASIVKINRHSLEIVIDDQLRLPDSTSQLILALAIIKPDRFAEAVKTAVQLGIAKIIPVISEYTQFKIANTERLNRCIIEAAEQSERLTLPILEKPAKLDEFITDPVFTNIIFANENENSFKLNSIKNFDDKTVILIGPEGGFSPAEQHKLKQNPKILSVTLGHTVLRSEVAAAATISYINLITA